jgi:hypothetical protein
MSENIGRNDPCPCGSGKKYKRCCLDRRDVLYDLWAEYHSASERLAREMMDFAERKCGGELAGAWQDFNLSDVPPPLDKDPLERQIFMPYFLFNWDPFRPYTGKRASRGDGFITRQYEIERGRSLSEKDRLFLEQAATQPVSFYEILWSDPGERIGLRDILIGAETEVIERLGSQSLRPGDIIYGQVWNLTGHSILGCLSALNISPRWKAEVVELRKKLRKKIAKQQRELVAEDLIRFADTVRLTYLTIRDALNRPPTLTNTDGDLFAFHKLRFRIESADEAFEALAPLAVGRTREELLGGAKLDRAGRVKFVRFDWLKKGNRRMPTWDNTILGNIRISGHSLIVEVNSEARATKIRAKITTRLDASAIHESTLVRSVEGMLAKSPKREGPTAKEDEKAMDDLLRDPEVRKKMQEHIQKQVDDWVHQKLPILRGRTPMDAVREPEGREIVESLLLDWERHAAGGAYQAGIQPDFGRIRELLKLKPVTSPALKNSIVN